MGPALLGLAGLQLNVFVNTRFASGLGDGPVTVLERAFRIFYLPVGLFGVAVAVVTTTGVSVAAAKSDRQALKRATGEGIRATLMFASASAVGLAILAEPVVSFLLERGRFSAENTLR